jgi:hypothetical protein
MCPELHCIGKSVTVHAIKAYGRMEKWLFSFLTLALDGGNQWPSWLGCFTPGEKSRYPHCRLGGPHSWTGHFRKEQNLFVPARDEPCFIGFPAYS